MDETDINRIANSRERNIRDYVVFVQNSMNIGIIRPMIIEARFDFKPMMFQMQQAIIQYLGAAIDESRLHLMEFWRFLEISRSVISQMILLSFSCFHTL